VLILAILLSWCVLSVALGFGIGFAIKLGDSSRPRLTRSHFDHAA